MSDQNPTPDELSDDQLEAAAGGCWEDPGDPRSQTRLPIGTDNPGQTPPFDPNQSVIA